jgi:glycosyltransferase involved in cell wall biosynthesis
MEVYVREHQLTHIDIVGYVSDEAKYRLLREAMCCVLPSECYEVFPMVLLESAAVGTPIVASRIGSLATLISEGRTGVLFSPGDSSDLRAKLEGLVAEPEVAIRMGEQARLWVEAEHTADAHYHALMRIYEQAMP